ncbi:hypothetical protein V8C37DRAFT_28407 [Trichoderma ceciliae]
MCVSLWLRELQESSGCFAGCGDQPSNPSSPPCESRPQELACTLLDCESVFCQVELGLRMHGPPVASGARVGDACPCCHQTSCCQVKAALRPILYFVHPRTEHPICTSIVESRARNSVVLQSGWSRTRASSTERCKYAHFERFLISVALTFVYPVVRSSYTRMSICISQHLDLAESMFFLMGRAARRGILAAAFVADKLVCPP